ncbi:hypothetical protein BDR26DRAFT_862081, partial [Obelidium mucronatum]
MTTQTDSSNLLHLHLQQRLNSNGNNSSSRTSISSSLIEDTDDPLRLKDLLRISRSANRKLDALVRSLQRHNDAIRNSLSSLQRTLTSERESRFLRDQIAFENAKKKEDEDMLDQEEAEAELLKLRDRIRSLEDQVDDLKFRSCSGNCFSSSGSSCNKSKKPPTPSATTPSTSTPRGQTSTTPIINNYKAGGSLPSCPNPHISTAFTLKHTPIENGQNRNISPISSHTEAEEGYGSGENDDGHVFDDLELANTTISSIGKEGPVKPIISRKNSFNNPACTSPHRNGSHVYQDEYQLNNTSPSPFDNIEFEEELEPSPVPLAVQFFDKASSQLVQQLNNNVRRWETVQSDLDEIVAEFQHSSGAGSLESIATTDSGCTSNSIIGDSECIYVIIESLVRVLEGRVDKLGNISGIQGVCSKFFSKFEYENLISKYQHTPAFLLETLERVCTTESSLSTSTSTAAKKNHLLERGLSTRALLFFPILNDFYCKQLVDAEDVVDWYGELEESIAMREELHLSQTEVNVLMEIQRRCVDCITVLKRELEARDMSAEEKDIDELIVEDDIESTPSGTEVEEGQGDSDGDEEEEWDDDADWLGEAAPTVFPHNANCSGKECDAGEDLCLNSKKAVSF